MHRLPVTFLIPVVKSLPPAARESLLAGAGLALEQLYEADRKIDAAVYDGAVTESAALSGNPAVGLAQGSLVDLRQLGLVAFVLMNAATLAEAFGHFRRYNTLVCTGIAYELEVKDAAVFRFVNQVPGRVVPRAVWDSVLASLVRLLGQLADRPVPVLSAAVPGAEAEAAAYRKALGVVPRFGQDEAALTVEASFLRSPVVYADPELLDQFRARADGLLAALPRQPTAARLRRLLASRCGRATRLADASRELALGIRTLQEHLRLEGTTFQAVADGFRRDFAAAELHRREHSIAEIAWLSGYSEQSAFQAAFKKWTGQTPLEFRNGEERRTPARQRS